MTTGLTMPAQSVMVSLADPFTTPDWTDLTPLVKKWGGKVRGRQHELQRFNAGTINLTLNNQDGRFSAWNTNGPYYNLLSANDASQDTGLGSWAALLRCVVTLATAPVVLDGTSCVQIKANSATSPMTAACGLPKLYAVTVGNKYTSMVSCLTAVTTRTITPTITWYKADGTTVVSTSSGSTFTDNTTTWTKGTVVAAVAPALAAFASVGVSIASQANNEIHYACRAALFNAVGAVPNTAWAPGQRGLVPARPLKITAKWSGTTYPQFYGYVDSWIPQYGIVKSEITLSVTDGMKLLSIGSLDASLYALQVASDSAEPYYQLADAPGSTTAADYSGLTNPTPAYGAVGFGAAGPLLTNTATAADFSDGTGAPAGYLSPEATVGAFVPGNNVWTFECWIQVPGAVTVGIIMEWPAGITAGSLYDTYLAVLGGQLVIEYGTNGFNTSLLIRTAAINDGEWHHVVVIVPAGSSVTDWQLYIDGVSVGAAANSSYNWLSGGVAVLPFVVGGNNNYSASNYLGMVPNFAGVVAQVAIYQGVTLSSTQVAKHYQLGSGGFAIQHTGERIAAILTNIGWPTALQSIATGIDYVQGATSSLVSSSALSYIQTVEASELGEFFIDPSGIATFYDRHYVILNAAATVSNATFASDSSGGHFRYTAIVPGEDDIDTWNDISTQTQGGSPQTYTNPASIKQYGRRTMTGYTSGLQCDSTGAPSDYLAAAQGQWLGAHYAQPITRIRSLTLSSVTDAGANFPQMLGRALLDRITVIWQPLDGSAMPLTQQTLVESITHTVTQDQWITTWELTPAETRPYFILDSSTLGQLDIDKLAY